MNLFQFSKEAYEITFDPITLNIEKFKKIINRDKSKDKAIAMKELSFIYFYSDIRSDYMYKTNLEERKNEIVKDLTLPKGWKIDKELQEAIDLYNERSTTVNSSLYKSACKAAMDVSQYLQTADELLMERDENGKIVTDISKITGALEKVPRIMANLTAAHTELVKEQKITEGRTKGSKEFSVFEDGLKFENE